MNERLEQIWRIIVAGFARLNPREQKLVLTFCALLVAVIAYFAAVEPLRSGRERLEGRISTLGDDLVAMRQTAGRIAQLQRTLTRIETETPRAADFSLFSFVDKAATASITPGTIAAMNPSRRRIREGEAESLVEVRLSTVPLTEMVGFLRKIEQATDPVYVKRVDMKRRYDDKARFDATIVIGSIERQ